jgi:catechol 2,3-dioxygenase-like lactoylglutathione lyase family enzyme
VETYDATIEQLRRDGHEIDPRTAHWGSPRAYVRDPAGHLVEVMAFAPRGRRE